MKWYVADVKCLKCGKKQLAVFPKGADERKLECPKCDASESRVIRYYPPRRS